MRQWPTNERSPHSTVMVRPRTISFFIVFAMNATACGQIDTAASLRNAAVTDPSEYFKNNLLRENTLAACDAGSAREQKAWAALPACKTARRIEEVKSRGWKP
jgi:hypothetical protein